MATKEYVVLNDLQIPFQDKPVLELVLGFIEELGPTGVILNGDVVDCYSLSEFDKDPLAEADLDREILEAGLLMWRLEGVKEKVWIEGNHEDRLRRTLWKEPKFAGLKALQFHELFQLPKYGFTSRPYGAHVMLGKLTVTHGDMVSKHSGWTARSHFEKYGTSVLVGHTHRLGIYYRTNVRGVHAAYENGCLCKMTPEYVNHPDWQQGFSVVHVASNGFFSVQQIPILRRREFFYGGQHITRKAAA